MKIGEVWFKRRQKPERERFFVIKSDDIKANTNYGFNAITMTRGSLWEECFIGNEALEGFEKRNHLLTEKEIAKYILLGDLNPAIL